LFFLRICQVRLITGEAHRRELAFHAVEIKVFDEGSTSGMYSTSVNLLVFDYVSKRGSLHPSECC